MMPPVTLTIALTEASESTGVQVAAPSVLRNRPPNSVPASSTLGFEVSTHRTFTAVSRRPWFAGAQEVPPSVDLKTPASVAGPSLPEPIPPPAYITLGWEGSQAKAWSLPDIPVYWPKI